MRDLTVIRSCGKKWAYGAARLHAIRSVSDYGQPVPRNLRGGPRRSQMCGISGVYAANNGPIDPDIVRRMNDSLRHRGPDDEGYYANPQGHVMLGHRRLSVIDLSTGRQPIFNECGTVAVVFNGEIYNFIELRNELIAKGYKFRTNTDTEVIANLYDEVGVECVASAARYVRDRHLGREAPGIDLDSRSAWEEAHLLRRDAWRFYFASEIQSLTEVPGLSREIDECAIDLYLTYSYIPSPWSIYRAIRKLPPAHLLRVRGDKLSLERYWQPVFEPKLDLDYGEAKRELLRLFTESVRLRLISDVPLGVFLSGGVDSSAVAAVMSTITSGPIKTFSIGFFPTRAITSLPTRGWWLVITEPITTSWMVEPQALDVCRDRPYLRRAIRRLLGDSNLVSLPPYQVPRDSRTQWRRRRRAVRRLSMASRDSRSQSDGFVRRPLADASPRGLVDIAATGTHARRAAVHD